MGYMGKILRVNLNSGKTISEQLDTDRAKNFIGGRGLGISYLLEEVNPKCDPLGSENKLMMFTGPLTGTKAPTGSRYMVVTKSPLTGAVTCSNSGGQFGHVLKKSGYDGIIIEGVSRTPVYLWIDNGKAELRNAEHLWGKDTHRTTKELLAETDAKAKVTCIGPAGENGVLFAAIMNDKNRAAGRSGVGAVMGAKKLKAVVVKGTRKIPIHNEEGFNAVVKEVLVKFKEFTQGKTNFLRKYGTANVIVGTHNFGVLPTRNFQAGTFEDFEKIGGEAIAKQYLTSTTSCFSCPIGCGRATKLPQGGKYQGEGEGPEYETVYSLGSNCGVGDLEALIKANFLCNELGIDTISMGSTVAVAMEMFEKGIIDDCTTGRSLRFGDADALVEMVKKTAHLEGFGKDLALGSYRMAKKYGHPELSITVKKQELAGYDPRGEKGMGLAYATSNIGASHMRAAMEYIEIQGVPLLIDALAYDGKAQIVKDWQDVYTLIDSAGLCVFFTMRNLVSQDCKINPDGILRFLNMATGFDYDLVTLLKAGERIFNAERLFLKRNGFTGKDDTLPPRIINEPASDGPAKGQVCELYRMLPEYYKLRDWDQNGHPSEEKIKELGLEIY